MARTTGNGGPASWPQSWSLWDAIPDLIVRVTNRLSTPENSHLFPCRPVAMEWMIRTADMMNDSFHEDYRPGAGSATVPDGNTDSTNIQNTIVQIVIQNTRIWILLSIVESKNRKALLLPGGSEGGVGGGTSWVLEHRRFFITLEIFLKKKQQDS